MLERQCTPQRITANKEELKEENLESILSAAYNATVDEIEHGDNSFHTLIHTIALVNTSELMKYATLERRTEATFANTYTAISAECKRIYTDGSRIINWAAPHPHPKSSELLSIFKSDIGPSIAYDTTPILYTILRGGDLDENRKKWDSLVQRIHFKNILSNTSYMLQKNAFIEVGAADIFLLQAYIWKTEDVRGGNSYSSQVLQGFDPHYLASSASMLPREDDMMTSISIRANRSGYELQTVFQAMDPHRLKTERFDSNNEKNFFVANPTETMLKKQINYLQSVEELQIYTPRLQERLILTAVALNIWKDMLQNVQVWKQRHQSTKYGKDELSSHEDLHVSSTTHMQPEL